MALSSLSFAALPETATIKRFAGERITGLSAEGVFNIVIRQGYFTGLSVEVPDDKKDLLTAKLCDDGIVRIEYKPEGNNLRNRLSAKVILTCTTIEELHVRGVCSVLLEDIIDIHNLDIDMQGVSKIENNGRLIVGTNLNLKAEGICRVWLGGIIADRVDLNVTGISKAELEGFVSTVKTDVSGISRARLSRLKADDATTSTSGMGRVFAASSR